MRAAHSCSLSSAALGDIDNDGHIDRASLDRSARRLLLAAFLDPGLREDFEHHLDAWDLRTGHIQAGLSTAHRRLGPARPQSRMSPAYKRARSDRRFRRLFRRLPPGMLPFGTEATGFPKFTGTARSSLHPPSAISTATGRLELAVTTRDGYLYAWTTSGNVNGAIDWASFHHDDQNSGATSRHRSAKRIQTASQACGSGCGFAHLGRSSLPMVCLLLLVFALRMWRRTRRS